MPSPLRTRWPRALIAALLLCVLLAATSPAATAQPTSTPRVLVVRGGSAVADDAVIRALQSSGIEVVSGPELTAFTGDAQALRSFDLVVLLSNASPDARLRADAAAGLTRFVRGGGSLILGHWLLQDDQLDALRPATFCGSNTVVTTTYRRAVPNRLLNLNVPASFDLTLTATAGNEACLAPLDDATVLFNSSNGGGTRDAPGLVGRNYEKGRVAAFSTLIGAAELQSTPFRTLFLNTAVWLASTRDTTPPRIRSFVVGGAGGFSASRELQISLSANDSGGAGVGGYLIREFGYSGDPNDGWERLGAGSWQPLPLGNASFTYTLSDQPGVRYLQAFVSDRAGNVSRRPELVLINYRPATVSIAQDELHIYRVTPGAGIAASVRLDVTGGNPDLYVFGPGVTFTPESDGPVEETAFVAESGLYQIEVDGHRAGTYSLTYATAPALRKVASPPDELTRRPRISVTAIFPAQPDDDPASLPEPPVDPEAGAAPQSVFLPLLRR